MARKRASAAPPKKFMDVRSYLGSLEPEQRKATEAVRKMILGADAAVQESIKWNAPSYARGEHFATFNAWARDGVQLILHHGAKKGGGSRTRIKDAAGLLEWLGRDRASIKFKGIKDVKDKKPALQSILRQWITEMP